MASVYDYSTFLGELAVFREKFPEIPVFSIGKSVLGRKLFALRLGKGRRRIFFNGAHHGMEWLTAKLLMDFAFDLAENNYNTDSLLDDCSLYIVPMVNPDGVELSKSGNRWQANARGVDLNHNYDALWHLSKEAEKDSGVSGPGPTRFSGAYPESEPETRAVANFVRLNSFDMAIAFHSQGQVIYWDFCDDAPPLSFEYAKRFEAVSPYTMDTPEKAASHGGFKDWFIKAFKKPGFTIEIGVGENPLPMEDLPKIYHETLPLMIEALKP